MSLLLIAHLLHQIPIGLSQQFQKFVGLSGLGVLGIVKIVLIAVAVVSAAYFIYKIISLFANKKKNDNPINDDPLRDEQVKVDNGIVVPKKEPISGTFACPSCGTVTVLQRELFPSVKCVSCGAILPDLVKIIQYRDDKYNELNRIMVEQRLQQEREERISTSRYPD